MLSFSIMPTQPATSRIGPYRIEREIARGGMGIVYLAHDTRLDRTVALKSLPGDVADDPERLRRFEREAKLLASLNHPNIAVIYDIAEGADRRRYLALEHVEGETLAQRLAGGALPIAEAIEICLQIASGMEAAHERGVIHRDLKPGNVMITHGDQVKIVDFGLAKGRLAPEVEAAQSPIWEGGLGAGAPTSPTPGAPASPTPLRDTPLPSSPTLTSPALSPGTIPGVILGTAPYLSPEQARGKPVDRRTDIWSWGCILYECLTGQMAFQGETVSDTIARILERDADWFLLPKATPPRVRELLRRSLEKDPKRRLRDIGDARLTLEEVRGAAPGSGAAGGWAAGVGGEEAVTGLPAKLKRVRAGAIFAIGLMLGAALAMNLSGLLSHGKLAEVGAREPVHLSMWIPPELRALQADITRDGKTIVMQAVRRRGEGSDEDVRPMLYTRRLDHRNFEPLRGTEGVQAFSLGMDGKWIGYVAPISDRSTKRRIFAVPVDGSAPPAPVRDFDESWTNGSAWLQSGDLIVGLAGGQEYTRVDRRTGAVSKPRRYEVPNYNGQLTLDSALPHDRGALLRGISYQQGVYHQGIGVLDLKTGKAKILVDEGGSPRYSPTGHLLFTRGGTLLAAPFDLNRLTLTGEPVAVLGGLRQGSSWNNAAFNLASTGTLVYALGGAAENRRRPIVINPDGSITPWSEEREAYKTAIAASPDGNRMAFILANADALDEIWVSRRGGTSSQKLVGVPGSDCDSPVWSADGRWLAYGQGARTKQDGVYVVAATGGAPRPLAYVAAAGSYLNPKAWFSDGSKILCIYNTPRPSAIGTIAVSAPGTPPSQFKVLLTGALYQDADLSPDGRWLAYISDEAGRFEAFVREILPDGTVGEPLQVSVNGAGGVAWSHDGRKLYYLTRSKAFQVTFDAAPGHAASAPKPSWDLDGYRIVPPLGDLLPDGRVVAIQKGEDEDELTHFDITLNFFDELKARLREKP